METQPLSIPPISLRWSAWHRWREIAANVNAGGVSVPPGPGVYEARYADLPGGDDLYIGKASSLRMRVKQGLVKGMVPHPGGQSIRVTEDVARILIRWAETDRPAAVEEELHRQHREQFGRLPKYTRHT